MIKTVDVRGMSEKEKEDAVLEAKLLERMSHPNIVRFEEVFRPKNNPDVLNIVMGYADGGDLQAYLKKRKGRLLKEPEILDIFTQMCLAIQHIHSKKILHRDLKTQNVFLSGKGAVQLGDFGIAKSLDLSIEKAKTLIGTPYYLSPEIVLNKPYSYASDIWALGVMLYEMCSLKMPFDASSLPMLTLKIIKGAYTPISSQFTRDLRNLVSQMLNIDDSKRPSINAILRKNFIFKRVSKFLGENDLKDNFTATFVNRIKNPEPKNAQQRQSKVKKYSKAVKEAEKDFKKMFEKEKKVLYKRNIVKEQKSVDQKSVERKPVELIEKPVDKGFKPKPVQSNKDRFCNLKTTDLFGTKDVDLIVKEIDNVQADFLSIEDIVGKPEESQKDEDLDEILQESKDQTEEEEVEEKVEEQSNKEETPEEVEISLEELDFLEKDQQFEEEMELKLTVKLEELSLEEQVEHKLDKIAASPKKKRKAAVKSSLRDKIKQDREKARKSKHGFEFEIVTGENNTNRETFKIEESPLEQAEDLVITKKKSEIIEAPVFEAKKSIKKRKKTPPKKNQKSASDLKSHIKKMRGNKNKNKFEFEVLVPEKGQFEAEIVEEKVQVEESETTKEEEEIPEEFVEEEVPEEENINALSSSAYFSYMNSLTETAKEKTSDYAALEVMRIDMENKLGLSNFRKLYKIVDENVIH